MLRRSVSGQYLYFSLVSAISGNAVTGASGNISGRKATDALSGLIVLSGNIIELGGGSYRANLFDWDCSGAFMGYFFSASGCVPVQYSLATLEGVSGGFWLASGNQVQVWSGTNVNVFSGNVVPLSGLTFIASGPFVNATATVASGSLYLASGSIFLNTFASGVIASSGGIATAWGSSGAVTIGQNLVSGTFVSVPIASISGTNAVVPIATISGTNAVVPIATISGVFATASLTSGQIVEVWSGTSVNVFSGAVYLASGPAYPVDVQRWLGVTPNALLSSGRLDAAFNIRTGLARSGTSTTIQLDAGTPTGTSGVFDGNVITIVAGSGVGQSRPIRFYSASGIATVAPAWEVAPDGSSIFTITPGYQPFSGNLFLTSGHQVALYSGQQVNLNSGNQVQVWSGTFVNVFSGQVVPLSGLTFIASGPSVVTSVSSGTLYLASGSIFLNTFASGVIASSGGIATAWGSSGAVTIGQNLVSGTFVSVPIASISGTNAVVPVATISGVFATASLNSGQFVLVSSGQLSGHIIDLLSGYSYIASGIFTKGSFTVASGELYLASGSIFRNTFASGVLAASGGITTAWGSSGAATVGQDLVSGTFVSVPIASISGVNAVVPVATISGVFGTASLNSGQFVLVSSGQLSGQQVDIRSGNQVQVWSGTFVNVFSGQVVPLSGLTWVASGAFVNATATVASGELYLASGSIFRNTFASGVLAASGGITTAWGSSGAATVGQDLVSGTFVSVPIATISGVNAVVPIATISGVFGTASLNSGQFVLVSSGQLSGQQVDIRSGNQVQIWSGTFVNVFSGQVVPLSGLTWIASGAFVNATATVASGELYLASGSIFRNTFASGVFAASGGITTAWGSSGAVTVGQNLVSGTFVSVPIASISGTNAVVPIATISGTNVVVPIGTISGTNVVVPIATISGVFGTASLNSGQFVLVSSGQLSGQQVDIRSGNQVQVWSGTFVNVFSGQVQLNSTQGTQLTAIYQTNVSKYGGSVNDASATTTAFNTTLTDANDFWNDALIVFTSGNLAGVSRAILDYANTNGRITVDEALPAAPDNGSTFIVRTDHIHPVSQIASAVSGILLASGSQVFLISGALSGQRVDLLSGNQVQVWSGTSVNVFSGTLVPLSGFTWLASGHPATLYSGQSVQLYSGQSTIASLVQDKSGYTLAPTGLDVIWASGPTGVASTWPQMVVQTWKRFFAKTTLTSTQLKTYLADGTTVSTTQTVSDTGTEQTQGAAT